MKALVVGDLHICDYVPVKRVDNFLEAQFIKIDKIKSIAEETVVDVIFLLGDVFDKGKPEIWLVNKVIDYWRDCSCVIYSLTGNHDLQGCRDGVPGTALGNLFTSGLFKRLDGNQEILGIPVRGIGHTREHILDLYKSDSPRIMFSHNLITPQIAPFDHLFIDDVLKVAKDCFIFCGDFHPPYEKYDPETNARFVNPGVVIRTSIAEKDIDPSVYYFEATPEDLVTSFKKISLGAPKGDLVFNISLHEEQKSEELNLKQFIDSINQTSFESQDLEELIKITAKESKVDEIIVKEAIERIKTAKSIV